MKSADLVSLLSQSIDGRLAQSLVDEFIELEEAFTARKWKATELDGGRFAEAASRIVYAIDSGNLNLTKGVDDCLRYIDSQQLSHAFPERQTAVHLAKVIRVVYKFRSQRGAVHVTPHYTANEIDSRLVQEMVRWILAELLRLFVVGDREVVAAIIRDLARFPFPLMRMFGDDAFLQATSFTTEEEILAHLLFNRGGLAQADIVRVVPKDASGISRAIKKLQSASCRQIKKMGNKWVLTDLGINRIEERLARETITNIN
ncbi:hypothetical protein BGO17_03970 [Candidatus Saccharibacteria bacterium 49-20]|nr:MAG: hypothetical protein BGO17_03970 [Candidatus Saccharibacteria bacterium 49-20]